MAEESFQEKTETATPKKREKTREEGQVAKSIEVSSVFVLLTGILVLYLLGAFSYEQLLIILRSNLSFESVPDLNFSYCVSLIYASTVHSLLFVMPIFLAVFAMALMTNFLQVGFFISYKVIEPKLSRISVIKGFGRLFSMRSVVEAVKATVKLFIIGIVSYYIVKGEATRLATLYDNDVAYILLYMLKVSFKIIFWATMVMVIIALLDYMYQRWQFEQQIKMTKQEVKDEFKQTEGDPQVKSRIKSLQQQAARKRMMQEVPKADVVVTNPTHLALAIQYDAAIMNAPKIIAKGAGQIAQRIKEIARDNDVPVIENKELAQNLYKVVDIGDEVPEALFGPVAELLAYVYRLKGKTVG